MERSSLRDYLAMQATESKSLCTGRSASARYPLRGTLIRYVDPFKSVAEEGWEALK